MNNNTMGVIAEYIPHTRDYDYEIVVGASNAQFPVEFEIPREKTGTLKSQGSVGACVAEVIAQIAESIYGKEMSEGYAYATLRSDTHNGYGLIVSKAMEMWNKLGTLPKSKFDILTEMPSMKEIVDKFPEFVDIAKQYPLSGFAAINYAEKTRKDNAIKDALMKHNHGLVAVSNDYFREAHCILLTGWNDKNGTYKYKNSWGSAFGDKGFAEIPKSEVDYVYVPFFEPIKLPFTDVSESDWFYKDVKADYLSGLMQGVSETLFDPHKPLTRAEAAALVNRIAKLIDSCNDTLNRVINEKINRIG
jgi:hypothetical protein